MEEKDLKTEEVNEPETVESSADENTAHDEELVILQKEVERLQQEKDDFYQRLLRVQAEYDNFKKRTQKEKEADRKYKSQDLVNELLPALDNFERALQVEVDDNNKNPVEGITMVYNQLKEGLESQGVEEIEAIGKEFDPEFHHAVMQVEDDDKEPNTVVEELQKGYLLKDRIIRPAMVKVNK